MGLRLAALPLVPRQSPSSGWSLAAEVTGTGFPCSPPAPPGPRGAPLDVSPDPVVTDRTRALRLLGSAGHARTGCRAIPGGAAHHRVGQAGRMPLAMLPSDSGDAPLAWLGLTLLVAVLVALVVGVLIGVIVRRLCRRWPVAVEAARRGRVPLRLLLVLIAVRQVLATTSVLGDWQDPLLRRLSVATIITLVVVC